MTTGRTVDIDAICDRSPELFVNGHNAWNHVCDHALGIQHVGEEKGWGLLLPSLAIELQGTQFADLQLEAKGTTLNPAHVRLGPIYAEFLDQVQRGVERASRVGWFWEERPGSDCRWFTFSPEGIFACLDEDFVRTGFMPERDPQRWSGGAGVPHFRLFQASLARVQAKYNRAVDGGRIENIRPEFESVLRCGLSEAAWGAVVKKGAGHAA